MKREASKIDNVYDKIWNEEENGRSMNKKKVEKGEEEEEYANVYII